MIDRYKLGRRLKAARQQKGLQVIPAAELSGSTKFNIWNYESGRHEPDILTVQRMCKAYGVTLSELLDER